MKRSIRFFSCFAMLILSVGLNSLNSYAQGISLSPEFLYTTNVPELSPGRNHFFDSADSALAGLAAYWSTIKNGNGETMYRFSGYKPMTNPVASFTNGRVRSYDVIAESKQDGHWSTDYAFQIGMLAFCPSGFEYRILSNSNNGYTTSLDCYRNVALPEPNCDSCQTRNFDKLPPEGVGNPIFPSTGLKQQTEIDYQYSGPGGLRYVRTYRSDRQGWSDNYQRLAVDLKYAASVESPNLIPQIACYKGLVWQSGFTHCFHPMPTGADNDFMVQRGNGRLVRFGAASGLNAAKDINDRVTSIVGNDGVKSGYQVYNSNDESTERYDISGRIQSITGRNGEKQTFFYSDKNTPVSIASKAGLLLSVTDMYNNQLSFAYDSNHRMVRMTDPAGGEYIYAYDEASSMVMPNRYPAGNLTSVTYPAGAKRVYWYNEQDKTSSQDFPYALTGITDENGKRFATYQYEYAGGRAISTEHAGGVEKNSFKYVDVPNKTEVTDPLGTVRTHTFTTVLGMAKISGQTQPAAPGSPAASTSIKYDENGNVASVADFKGVITSYIYDLTRNLETSKTEAFGTPQARTITTVWHAGYRIPTRVFEPQRVTIYTHDPAGNVLTKVEQATLDLDGSKGIDAVLTGSARKWTYTYNPYGQVWTVTGPRTDAADVTTYTYDTKGNLASVKNAVGQLTTLTNYDANGRVGTITDPNNIVTTLTYWPRGWLKSRTVTAGGVAESTSYDYDDVGQFTLVTLPDASTVTYTYDDAHRLTSVGDSLNNSITYTLDNMGNRRKTEVKDPSGVLARQTTRVIDVLNRLQQSTGAQQ